MDLDFMEETSESGGSGTCRKNKIIFKKRKWNNKTASYRQAHTLLEGKRWWLVLIWLKIGKQSTVFFVVVCCFFFFFYTSLTDCHQNCGVIAWFERNSAACVHHSTTNLIKMLSSSHGSWRTLSLFFLWSFYIIHIVVLLLLRWYKPDRSKHFIWWTTTQYDLIQALDTPHHF